LALIEPNLGVLPRDGLIAQDEHVFGQPSDGQLRRRDFEPLKNRTLVCGDEGVRRGDDRRLPIPG
jgi:hypothetical protein